MEEFNVNEFLSLRFQDPYTYIYVAGKKFIHCKFLLLTIPVTEAESLEEIRSIDEAVEQLDKSLMELEPNSQTKIDPRTEFWAHCSNLQAWYENNYDTRLLHRNIAFPLLKELTEVGDPIAQRAFKEEIAKRFSSGFISVMLYLITEGYLNYLEGEDLENILDSMPNLFIKLREQLDTDKSEECDNFLYYFLEILNLDKILLESLVLNFKMKLIQNLILILSYSPIDGETVVIILETFEKLRTCDKRVWVIVRNEIEYQFNNGTTKILRELIFDKFFKFLDKSSIQSILENICFQNNLIHLIEKDLEYILDSLIEFFILIYNKIGKKQIFNLLKIIPNDSTKYLKNQLEERKKLYFSRPDRYRENKYKLINIADRLLTLINEKKNSK